MPRKLLWPLAAAAVVLAAGAAWWLASVGIKALLPDYVHV